ncbi:unnamed protein product [Rotaria sordida]|uniref:Uncharacterized protein n=1 Tax=Rotaria sordida TaxID=392033 RepID=A0A814Q534_9BILA|nr:unnamed protein product [Rotaria sordida]CAF1115569.1 unnamed protein product [Rotaria sordida]CAF3869261.1 unnamed protein product [Rotaria sordida]CAF3979581.1 unnamed protein product [Rotaria sordida]
MYSPEELAAEDGRKDKTGVELLHKKRLIETMNKAYAELKKINKITLNLCGLTPSYNLSTNFVLGAQNIEKPVLAEYRPTTGSDSSAIYRSININYPVM